MAITVDTLKAHLNVTGTDDDGLLTRLLAAATSHIEGQLGFTLADADEFPDGTPEDVDQAVLMLASHWYENREGSIHIERAGKYSTTPDILGSKSQTVEGGCLLRVYHWSDSCRRIKR